MPQRLQEQRAERRAPTAESGERSGSAPIRSLFSGSLLSVFRSPLPVTAFASDDARRLLEQNGLADLDALFLRGASARQRHKGRTVWESRLQSSMPHPRPHKGDRPGMKSAGRDVVIDGEHTNGQSDNRTIGQGENSHCPIVPLPQPSSLISHFSLRVFVKMHWGRGRFWPRLSDLKSGQAFQSLPMREWDGLHRLKALGLDVAEPLALFHEGLWRFRSAVVLAAVPPKASVDEMIATGEWSRLLPEQRETLLDAMLAAIKRIHSAGLGWRGASSRHFYPQLQDDGTWRVWLIDCEGIHPRATRRTFERNFRRFHRSMKHSGADEATLQLLRKKIDDRRANRPAKAA